jgi:cellulose synthase/poly-beta-1,6-N-acetylglucosamine synthase-like glycosyltransferase
VQALDYPEELLEIFVIVEDTDTVTRASLESYNLPDYFHVEYIQERPPFTKGRGMQETLVKSTGEFLTIYDAESKPETMQLRKAAKALREAQVKGQDIVAQAIIRIENRETNMLTKFFAAEYLE